MSSPREPAQQRGRSFPPGLTSSLAIADTVIAMLAQ